MISIPIKLDKGAEMPTKVHDYDAGYDLKALTRSENYKFIEYGTGVYMHIPKGYVGLIFPRSSITKRDLMLKNSVGVIDSGYLGEIRFRFYPTEEYQKSVHIGGGEWKLFEREDYKIGEYIGQILIIELPEVTFEQVDELEESERGIGGYGSTDEKRKTA